MARPILDEISSLPFAWQGMQVDLPPDWNLRAFRGSFRKGALVFSDLRRPRLHVRWKSRGVLFKKSARPVERLTAGLRRRHPGAVIAPLSAGTVQAVQIDLPTKERLVLVTDAMRFYELHWPEAPPPSADGLTARFREALDHPPAGTCKWNVYGARGTVPATARLRRASLLPGSTYLYFTHCRRAILFGALSMADRLLQGCSLRSAMEKQLQLKALEGTWEEAPFSMRFQGEARRRFRPALPFCFCFEHDAAANQLRWELTTARRFLTLWKPPQR